MLIDVDIRVRGYVPPYPIDTSPMDGLQAYCDLLTVDRDDLREIAKVLRGTTMLDRSIRCALADRLDPPESYEQDVFVWRRNRGRPRNFTTDDAIEGALATGDLCQIAKHLRDLEPIDPRVITWLAEQLAPASEHDSHFRIRRHRKKRKRDLALHSELMRIGGHIREQVRRRGARLESALHDAIVHEEKNSRPLSYPKARRAYDYYRRQKPLEFLEQDNSGVSDKTY